MMNPPRIRIVLVLGAAAGTTATRATTPLAFCPQRRGLDGGTDGIGASRAGDDDGGGGPPSRKAYNDGALFNFHMLTQRQKIRDYSALETYVDTASAWNLAWHESFVRNGLSDFVPPMAGSLNALVIGDRQQGAGPSLGLVADVADAEGGGGAPKVSGEGPAAATAGSLATADREEVAPMGDAGTSIIQQSRDSSCSFLTAVFDSDNRLGGDEDGDGTSDALNLASYDCVMDRGLLADLLASTDTNDRKAKEDMARLLYEATRRICEMGIYVASTPPISPETKEYLRNVGQLLGLQWEFDLDGISDENSSVSVARKFGTCPAIGWQTMARLIED